MASRQIMDGPDGLLNLRAATIHWGEENGPEGGDGARSVIHLRWMLNPSVGLPRQPFRVWRAGHLNEDQNPTKQFLADNADWEEIEVVGLPVEEDPAPDDPWRHAQYDRALQGRPSALLSPRDAAIERLRVGAPRRGWTPHDWNGVAGPAWEDTDLKHYLHSLTHNRLWTELGNMSATVALEAQAQHAVSEDQRLVPSLLLTKQQWEPGEDEASTNTWYPLMLLGISAGSDPLAALAMGYGTAFADLEDHGLWMVSVRHVVHGEEIEIADIAKARPLSPGLPAPGNISAGRTHYTRPQTVDGPSLETAGLTWDRPTSTWHRPLVGQEQFPPEIPQAAAYAIARYDDEATLLLEPREGGGYRSYVSAIGQPTDAARCIFNDHLRIDLPSPQGSRHHYGVAGQDLYGRWSDWVDVDYAGAAEGPHDPRIVSATLTAAGCLTVDFSWDWSDRSPEFIHLSGQFEDAGMTVVNGRLKFGGAAEGTGADFVALTPERKQGAWGTEQDRDPASIGTRLYRWTPELGPVDFRGKSVRTLRVTASGQCHLHQLAQSGWNGNTFGVSASVRVWDPTPPKAPPLDTPRWASLPDAAGVSRFNLRWTASPTAELGYYVYEATETAVRAVFGLAPPDLATPVVDRLNELLRHPSANFAAKKDDLRKTFRRVNAEPLPRESISHELPLPRGSKILHFFTVAAVGGNNVESRWPENKDGYTSVAVPRTATPQPPSMTATRSGDAVAVQISGLGVTGGVVELYRLAADQRPVNVDAMGPPIRRIDVPNDLLELQDNPTPGWRRIWYGATVRSRQDDTHGIVSTRSPESTIAFTLLPPTAGPELPAIAVNQRRSTVTESLLSWTVAAPRAMTPFGPHTLILEVRPDPAAATIQSIRTTLEDIPLVISPADLAPPAGPDTPRLFAMKEGAVHRIYAWVNREPGEARHVTVKLADPVNRLVVRTVDVPAVVYEPIDWGRKAEDWRGQNGLRLYFDLDPAPAEWPAQIWGTDTYTDDSPIAVAAVHAGLITTAGGQVCIEIRPGQQSYQGSTRNGVTSTPYHEWGGSYVFVPQ